MFQVKSNNKILEAQLSEAQTQNSAVTAKVERLEVGISIVLILKYFNPDQYLYNLGASILCQRWPWNCPWNHTNNARHHANLNFRSLRSPQRNN